MRRTAEEKLVLVDLADRAVGEEEKLAAHRDGGKLHRAFSVFIVNRRGEHLLQQRASTKYHFRGLWANACCGHPRPQELLASAARRRLREEMGIDAELDEIFSFLYTAEDRESGLTEREIDHVFVGRFDGFPQPHPDEIDAIRWARPETLEREFQERPERFAPWLLEAAPRVFASSKAGAAMAGGPPRRLPGLLAVLVALCAVFASGVLRSPERRLPGSETGQTVRPVPTGESELASALPGHGMVVRASLWIVGLEPTADGLARVNLPIHLALALLLALLAYYLAAIARPESLTWPALTALYCGLFALLFPPILFWGRSVSLHGFTVLPLFVVAVAGRWLRASWPPGRGRSLADVAVGLSVFAGAMTDILFWVLVPYLVATQVVRARRGRPRTSDPLRWTVLLPFAAALTVLAAASLVGTPIETMTEAAMGSALVPRLREVVASFRGPFYDPFRLLGFFCIGLSLATLLPRERSGSVPWVARGVLLDLFVPVLASTFLLAPHAEALGVAAVRFVPFVVLAWTVLTPLVVDGIQGRRRKSVAWALYAAFAVFSIGSGSAGNRWHSSVRERDGAAEALPPRALGAAEVSSTKTP